MYIHSAWRESTSVKKNVTTEMLSERGFLGSTRIEHTSESDRAFEARPVGLVLV